MKTKLKTAMIEYYGEDRRRINHFLKVHSFAKLLGECERLDERTLFILECAALVHDIGIKNAEAKYNSSSGHYQEIEGAPEAEKMMKKLGFEDDVIKRVSFLVAHHHTYAAIDGIDFELLVEADFLVNMDEECMDRESVGKIREKMFKSETGKKILDSMFGF